MSDTAAAVETAVTEAFGAPTEAPAAPAVVRREDVRDQIMNAEWKEDAELQAETAGTEASEGAAAAETGLGQGESTPTPSEPPPEAIIGEGGNRIVVRTTDGKFAAAPDVKLEFAVGDKVYLKSPAELVRMAKDGVAGQQFYHEVQQYREQVPQLVSQYEALQQELEAQRALNLEILNDETAYLQRRDEWTLLNSPEQRLARLEQERQQEYEQRLQWEQQTRAQQAQQQQQQAILSFYESELKPIQDELLEQYPEVPLEAKMGRLAIDTLPMMQNGVIPPQRLAEYREYLNGPFRQWVRQEAARYQSMTAQQQQQVQHAQRQAQQQAQRMVQTVGRQMAPAGRAGADVPPPAPKPRNREEAKAMIIGRTWQDF